MGSRTVLVGSLEALAPLVRPGELFELTSGSDVVVVATAAAFTGLGEAALKTARVFEASGATPEALMIADRTSGDEEYFVQRLTSADLVVLADGSALHAKSVWRGTRVGEAIRDAACLVAVGACATVLGPVMIDPRGGAPTVGLGYRAGPVVTLAASEEQLARSRHLLGADVTLVVLGPLGVVVVDADSWRLRGDDVVVTRGDDVVEL